MEFDKQMDEALKKMRKPMEDLQNLITSMPNNMIKAKKNVRFNGKDSVVSLMGNGNILIEFHEKAGEEFFNTLPDQLSTVKTKKKWLLL